MINRLMKWTYLGALLGGGALLQFGGCGGLFSGPNRWIWAILQEDLFG